MPTSPSNNDTREFELLYERGITGLGDKSLWFTQRELRMILKHVEGRNDYLHTKIKNFILEIDHAEKRPTNFDTRVPRTPVIRVPR